MFYHQIAVQTEAQTSETRSFMLATRAVHLIRTPVVGFGSNFMDKQKDSP